MAPTLDYNMKLPSGAGDVTTFFTADTADDAHAQGTLTRYRRGRPLSTAYGYKPNATGDGARAYADYLDLCAKRYSPEGTVLSYWDWAQSPIFGARLLTPPGEIATALRVSIDFLNDHIDPGTTLYVCALHSKVVSMAWSPSSEYPTVSVENAV